MTVLTICSLLSPRVRTQHAQDSGREDLLHVLRAGRHPAHPRHVPVHRRAPQHLRHLRPQAPQEVLQAQEHRGLADQPHLRRHEHVQHRAGGRGGRLLYIRGLAVPRLVVLLFHHPHHYWLRGLRGAAEAGRAADQARVRGLQPHLHPVRADRGVGRHEPSRSPLLNHEHGGRAQGGNGGRRGCARSRAVRG